MQLSRFVLPGTALSLLLSGIPQQSSQQTQQLAVDKSGSYTLTVNPKLVVLDVVVTDKQGNPVTSLKKEDFLIQEDKQPQLIYSFEPPTAHALPPNVVIHSTEELDRLAPNASATIIVLDENVSGFRDIYTAHQAIQQYLKAQPQMLTQPTMLVAVNADKMIVLRDYTQERDTILTALNHHAAGAANYSGSQARNGLEFKTAQIEASYRSLTQVAQATAGHPGHKNVIWVGRGLPKIFPSGRVALELQVQLQKMIDLLIASRVTLSTIDLNGPGFDRAPIGDSVVNFAEVAVATGGKPFYNRNDVDSMIDTGIRNGNHFYTLSYIPTSGNNAKGAFRHIRVIMKDPTLQVTTRTGYYPNPQKEPGSAVAEDMAAWHQKPKNTIDAKLIDSTLVYDGIPLAITRSATPGQVIVSMNANALRWVDHGPDQPRTAPVQISCLSFDKKDKVLVHAGTDTEARSSAMTSASPLDVSFSLNCNTDPRAVRLRVVVQTADPIKVGAANLDLAAK